MLAVSTLAADSLGLSAKRSVSARRSLPSAEALLAAHRTICDQIVVLERLRDGLIRNQISKAIEGMLQGAGLDLASPNVRAICQNLAARYSHPELLEALLEPHARQALVEFFSTHP